MTSPELVVAATANPHKLAEMTAVLGSALTVRPRPDGIPDVPEDEATLEGNARLKALAVCAATGLPALADDTGLEVKALGGAPGVRSARYAGDDADDRSNVALLLSEMDGVADRSARFRTVLVLARPDGSEMVVEGSAEGAIALAPAGEGGFGYDPVFLPTGSGGLTFAQLSPAEKNRISHRGRALRALLVELRRPG